MKYQLGIIGYNCLMKKKSSFFIMITYHESVKYEYL